MAIIVEMPRLSDTMTEGTIASWMKQPGDKVAAGDGLAEVETDKAIMVFESFDAGTLRATLVNPGDTVPLGAPIAVLGKADEDISAVVQSARERLAKILAGAAGASAAPAPAEPTPAPVVAAAIEPIVATPPAPTPVSPAPAAAAPAAKEGGETFTPAPLPAPHDADGRRIPVSPLARRLAAERGLDLGAVAGTGPRGRIVAADLEGLAAPRRFSGRLVAARAAAREDESVRVTQMRKTIAKRLVEAKNSAPHFYLTITVEADRLVAVRSEVNALLKAENHPFSLSYNDFVQRAAVLALRKHPDVNAGWEGATIRRFGAVHLGFAVALPDGLITPVIRNAESLGLVAMAAETRELADRARKQQLESAEYSGNTFCISNLGMFGIEHFTAIINPPAACILAVGALSQQPVVRDGQLAIGHRMTMTLSCDHRVVDGAMGAAFLKDLKGLLEAPSALLLDT
jgi:pyruvate dehydrogenase E2 component (dihydrolipoamide acetyltransferase)